MFQQPPSGGCVLKREEKERIRYVQVQPPSGGCVLKHHWFASSSILLTPAAFGRLCVETLGIFIILMVQNQPPSGGCVLKLEKRHPPVL